jgi:NADH-quinone oxidoreductase subunit N
VQTAIEQINAAAGLVLPELFLLASVCLMFLVGPCLVGEGGQAGPGLRNRWSTLSLLTIAAAWLTWFNHTTVSTESGPFRVDELVWYVRGASLSIGAVLVLLLWNQIDDGRSAEAHACLLAILAGVNLTALANDLVSLFLALELVSIPTYVLLYLPRRDTAMREATIKYFLLSVFSAALVLYGMTWLFGAAGTTSLSGIARAATSGELAEHAVILSLALALILAGLAFRITAFPFHFYAPDVFQGSTSSAAAMLSFVPKIVGFAALLRLLPLASGAAAMQHWVPTGNVRDLLAVVAVLTMFTGNLLALRQKHLHRLLAYSSVAHAGYMLVGLTVGDGAGVSGLSALLFYLVAYGLVTIGVFALLAAGGNAQHPVQTDSDLAGLSRTRPMVALLLAVCLFSLTGLPPTAGFLGKLNLFFAAWSSGTEVGRVLAAVLAVNAVISAWYYLRLVAVMYLDAPARAETTSSELAPSLAGILCAAGTIVLFVLPQWLWDAAVRVTQ